MYFRGHLTAAQLIDASLGDGAFDQIITAQLTIFVDLWRNKHMYES